MEFRLSRGRGVGLGFGFRAWLRVEYWRGLGFRVWRAREDPDPPGSLNSACMAPNRGYLSLNGG